MNDKQYYNKFMSQPKASDPVARAKEIRAAASVLLAKLESGEVTRSPDFEEFGIDYQYELATTANIVLTNAGLSIHAA